MTRHGLAIHWFRRDLRLADNPALVHAARAGRIVPVFILDPDHADEIAPGAAGRAWLHRALQALDRSLGGALNFYRGRPQEILPKLARRTGADLVTWGRLPDPALAVRDERVEAALGPLFDRGLELAPAEKAAQGVGELIATWKPHVRYLRSDRLG